MSKRLLTQAFDLDYEAILAEYLELQERALYSLDGEEGKRAYLDKREPKWQ
jgi:enoyl-CoA hydratase/carnithine racemase